MGEATTLKIFSFQSVVEPSFWHKLCHLKLEEDKLEEKERRIRGFYLHPKLCSITVDCTSYNENYEMRLGQSAFTSVGYICQELLNYNCSFLSACGLLINFNSAAKFKDYNKNELIERVGKRIMSSIENGEALKDPTILNQFILITYINLKTYEFIYWFGFPALASIEFKVLSQPVLLSNIFDTEQMNNFLMSHSNLPDNNKGSFGVEVHDKEVKCITIENFIDLRNDRPNITTYLCFLDPSSEEYCPGWPLRNLLALIKYHSKGNSSLNIICLRIGAPFKSSFVLNGTIEGEIGENTWIGWEKNKRGKYGPRLVNLKNDMDPVRLADSSAELNLKLMKWRLVPDIDLEIIKSKKCLLLGAGTLGCNVARSLLGWGVRYITFVDSGCVSFSNPVRQSLFTHKDCDLGKGAKFKATAAAEALKEILPTVFSAGVIMDIPMPGHTTANLENAIKLHELIENHDVVFLLTDSRESRWLPTVISSVLNKLAFTAALGYDTYLVMRHGVKSESPSKLGCYFCNDITAPGNSMEDRTLDQQCTVTRPGVSNMAASLSVELLVSVLQDKNSASPTDETVLGILPHSIRGFLSQFSHILPTTNAFSQCIACSTIVENAYLQDREVFLKNVFMSTKYLEDLTGLTELHNITDTLADLEISDTESINEIP